MNRDDARRVLDQIPELRHPCDLDLLVFFARHRHSLLTSEQLAVWLGYGSKHIADSLELLLKAGFITRTQNPTHAARMYVFDSSGTSGGWLPSLFEAASTREGRLALLDALPRHSVEDLGPPEARSAQGQLHRPRPRPTLVRLPEQHPPHTKAG